MFLSECHTCVWACRAQTDVRTSFSFVSVCAQISVRISPLSMGSTHDLLDVVFKRPFLGGANVLECFNFMLIAPPCLHSTHPSCRGSVALPMPQVSKMSQRGICFTSSGAMVNAYLWTWSDLVSPDLGTHKNLNSTYTPSKDPF